MAGKPPDGAKLYEAALNHLARYAATEAGLARVDDSTGQDLHSRTKEIPGVTRLRRSETIRAKGRKTKVHPHR